MWYNDYEGKIIDGILKGGRVGCDCDFPGMINILKYLNPHELRKKYEANVYIDCVLMANTIPGKPVVEAFKKGIETYKEMGYPEEYQLHHQGGAIGYTGRDYKINFQTTEVVQENQGFVWNPSITGSKSEDTMLTTSDGPLLFSKPIIFPQLEVKIGDHYTFIRPDILER
jgi:hypothetical protein